MNRLNGTTQVARGEAEPRSGRAAEEGSGFGRRKERPDAGLARVLNTGSNGPTQRTFRSISPPLD